MRVSEFANEIKKDLEKTEKYVDVACDGSNLRITASDGSRFITRIRRVSSVAVDRPDKQ